MTMGSELFLKLHVTNETILSAVPTATILELGWKSNVVIGALNKVYFTVAAQQFAYGLK
jgi:hypothetical protein